MGVRPVGVGSTAEPRECVTRGVVFLATHFCHFSVFRSAGIGGGRTATGPGAKFSPRAWARRARARARAPAGAAKNTSDGEQAVRKTRLRRRRATVARLTQNRTYTYSIHKAYEAYCAHSGYHNTQERGNTIPDSTHVHAVRERQRARRNRRAQCTGARQQRACAR